MRDPTQRRLQEMGCSTSVVNASVLGSAKCCCNAARSFQNIRGRSHTFSTSLLHIKPHRRKLVPKKEGSPFRNPTSEAPSKLENRHTKHNLNHHTTLHNQHLISCHAATVNSLHFPALNSATLNKKARLRTFPQSTMVPRARNSPPHHGHRHLAGPAL